MSDWVSDYYADVDAMRLDAYLDRHAPDASVVFGNNPPSVGRQAVREAIGGLFAQLSGVHIDMAPVLELFAAEKAGAS